jgi:hypothetical protein
MVDQTGAGLAQPDGTIVRPERQVAGHARVTSVKVVQILGWLQIALDCGSVKTQDLQLGAILPKGCAVGLSAIGNPFQAGQAFDLDIR